MNTAVMEKILDQSIDLSITHVEKNFKIIRSFWIKGGTNE